MHGVSQSLTSQKYHLASGVGFSTKDQFEIDHILHISAGMAVQKIVMFFVCNNLFNAIKTKSKLVLASKIRPPRFGIDFHAALHLNDTFERLRHCFAAGARWI
jgi:hypothetical protein